MPTGYCTTEDLRRALRKADLPGDAAQDPDIAIDAITGQSGWLEKATKRHWYEPGGITEDEHDIIPTATKTRDDEEDIPTSSAFVAGEPAAPKTSHQDYARIRLDRRDAGTISQLLVAGADGYTDWVSSNDYSGGQWPGSLGDDYYVRVNNDGWSELYIDVTNLLEEGEDDEYVLDSFANAVYVSFEYGHEGIPTEVRRAVAMKAAAQLLLDDEAALGIPENASFVSAESKVQAIERQAEELLEVHM